MSPGIVIVTSPQMSCLPKDLVSPSTLISTPTKPSQQRLGGPTRSGAGSYGAAGRAGASAPGHGASRDASPPP